MLHTPNINRHYTFAVIVNGQTARNTLCYTALQKGDIAFSFRELKPMLHFCHDCTQALEMPFQNLHLGVKACIGVARGGAKGPWPPPNFETSYYSQRIIYYFNVFIQ